MLVVIVVGSGALACSGSMRSDASAGDAGAAGSAGGGAASGGGPQANAGTAGAAASAAGAAGASGDTSGTGSCPVWPRARLMPIVGPFFYGMDPGPCADQRGLTYVYQAGRLLSSTDQKQVTTTYGYDAQGTPTGSTASDQTSEVFEFGAGYLLDTVKKADGSIAMQYRYTLSQNGYPLTVSLNFPGNPTPVASYSYSYSSCRLLERTQDSGGTAPEKLSYTYDNLGHVSARVCDCINAVTFDYSCWK
jgi:YD repeat-containing protein